MRLLRFCLACYLTALIHWVSFAYAQDFVTIYSRYKERVAHIEIIGELYDGTFERSSGSGLLIGYGLVLTNSHVLPREQNFKELKVNVRLGSRNRNPRIAFKVAHDEERDLAILFLDPEVEKSTAGGERCPMPALSQADYLPPGSEVAVLGYPLDQDLSIAGGLLSNQGNEEDYRWQTDTVLNKGNSGGPFFSKDGTFAGVAVGGIVTFSIGNQKIDVDGVNFFIPATTIRESPLFDYVLDVQRIDRCWADYPSSEAVDPRSFEGVRSDIIRMDYQFSATKDDHP